MTIDTYMYLLTFFLKIIHYMYLIGFVPIIFDIPPSCRKLNEDASNYESNFGIRRS